MDLLNETVLLKTKSTLFNLLIREISQFLCYERLLNMTYVAYKTSFFREMQFLSHCYTVVSYQALFRLSVYKIPAVYLSGAKHVCFYTIRDFGSPTKPIWDQSLSEFKVPRRFHYKIKSEFMQLRHFQNGIRVNLNLNLKRPAKMHLKMEICFD